MKHLIVLLLLFVIPINFALANGLPDTDKDGVPDKDEINIYYTDINDRDTDNDGYGDWEEINKGYSPLNPKPVKLNKGDMDNDGLTDLWEIRFGTSPLKADMDNDGFSDGDEVKNGFDPLQSDNAKLNKVIKINLERQELSNYLGAVPLNTFPISSGAHGTTPKGNFTIGNKSLKAWSPYGLWMPYWLGIEGERFGLHELPVWPNGYREGVDHLGRPVSHGCIRLGIGPAKILYDWVEVGTKVVIN